MIVAKLLIVPSVAALTCLAGCHALQVENKTLKMSNTLSDMQYRQVMDNLAMVAANPSALPYFNVPTSGKATIQRTGQANVGLGFNLITAATYAPQTILSKYFGSTVLNSITPTVQGVQQNIEEWDTNPNLDPVKQVIMQGLYRRVLGLQTTPFQQRIMDKFFYAYNSTEGDSPDNYHAEFRELYRSIGAGWVCVGDSKPRDAIYFGKHDGKYVWVSRNNLEQLTNLTIAIVDTATANTAESGQTTKAVTSTTQVPTKHRAAPGGEEAPTIIIQQVIPAPTQAARSRINNGATVGPNVIPAPP